MIGRVQALALSFPNKPEGAFRRWGWEGGLRWEILGLRNILISMKEDGGVIGGRRRALFCFKIRRRLFLCEYVDTV